MACRCADAMDGGAPASGFAFLATGTFTLVSPATTTVNLASVPVDGASVMVRNFCGTGVRTDLPGQGSGLTNILFAEAIRNAIDGPVLLGRQVGPQWPLVQEGYLPPLAFFGAATPFDLVLTAGGILQIAAGPGLAGETVRYRYAVELYLDGGALRLHP